MCDVDHFKRFNDTYGHPAGDRVLQSVARALMNASRAGDQLYRYGGEEFLLILPNQSLDGGHANAERLRSAVEALAIPHEASPAKRVTISVGLSVLSAQPRDDDSEMARRRGRRALSGQGRGAKLRHVGLCPGNGAVDKRPYEPDGDAGK